MPASTKYALLKNHSRPAEGEELPKTYTGGCNRAFKIEWLKQYSWLCYSQKIDGAFCLPCAIFNGHSGIKNFGALVTRPFRTWQKKTEKFCDHEKKQYHQVSLQFADDLIRSIDRPEKTLPVIMSEKKAANITRNRNLLKSIARAILFCARQCIALRGHDENLKNSCNPGNFLSLLHLLSENDECLRTHLQTPTMRNATYISPQTQNEVIQVMGSHIIKTDLFDELRDAKFFAILADEVTSNNTEHLALCVRFVDKECNIREEFLTFIPLQRITGEQIAETILNFLDENNIDAENIRGQGYDGACNMSSDRVGVQRASTHSKNRTPGHLCSLQWTLFESCDKQIVLFIKCSKFGRSFTTLLLIFPQQPKKE